MAWRADLRRSEERLGVGGLYNENRSMTGSPGIWRRCGSAAQQQHLSRAAAQRVVKSG